MITILIQKELRAHKNTACPTFGLRVGKSQNICEEHSTLIVLASIHQCVRVCVCIHMHMFLIVYDKTQLALFCSSFRSIMYERLKKSWKKCSHFSRIFKCENNPYTVEVCIVNQLCCYVHFLFTLWSFSTLYNPEEGQKTGLVAFLHRKP